MRTTLDLDEDVLQAAKELAVTHGVTAGKMLSNLARKALTPTGPVPKVRNGVPFQVTVLNTPLRVEETLNANFGAYAQDSWNLDRLTLRSTSWRQMRSAFSCWSTWMTRSRRLVRASSFPCTTSTLAAC